MRLRHIKAALDPSKYDGWVLKDIDYEGKKKIIILLDPNGKEVRLSPKESADWIREEKYKVKEDKNERLRRA